MKKNIIIFLVLIAVAFLLQSCVPGMNSSSAEPSGFFMGVWHGWIAPISLVLEFFDPKFSVYDSNNTGVAYDFGFYIAIIGGFGGFQIFRKKKKDN